jgi:hypothetical protein
MVQTFDYGDDSKPRLPKTGVPVGLLAGAGAVLALAIVGGAILFARSKPSPSSSASASIPVEAIVETRSDGAAAPTATESVTLTPPASDEPPSEPAHSPAAALAPKPTVHSAKGPAASKPLPPGSKSPAAPKGDLGF